MCSGGRSTETRGGTTPVWRPRSVQGPREPHLLPAARSALLLKHQLTLAGRPPAADSGAAWDSWLQDQFPHEGRLPGDPGARGRGRLRGLSARGSGRRPAPWRRSDCRVTARTPAPLREAPPSTCDRDWARVQGTAHTPAPGPPPPPATGSGPLRGLTSRDARHSWVLMTSGGQLPGHQISPRKAGPYGEPPEPRAAGRSSHCPESVLSRTLGAADPPTRSGPQALASDLRDSARALATTQTREGQGKPAGRVPMRSPAEPSLGQAVCRPGCLGAGVTGGHVALQSRDTAAGQDFCRDPAGAWCPAVGSELAS